MPKVDSPPMPVKAPVTDAPEGTLAVNLFDLDHVDPFLRGLVLGGKLDVSGVVRVDRERPDETAVVFRSDLLTAAAAVDILRGELRRESPGKILRAYVRRGGWVRLPSDRPLTLVRDGECILNPQLFERELPVADAVPPRSRGPVRINNQTPSKGE